MEISRLKLWDIGSIQASRRRRGTEDNTQSGLGVLRCTFFMEEVVILEFLKVQILAKRLSDEPMSQFIRKLLLTKPTSAVLSISQYCPFCADDYYVKWARMAARGSIVAPTNTFLVGTWLRWHSGPRNREGG